jgi:GNAT superfamily N-acetyltransferase
MNFVIRKAEDGDAPFILNSWLLSGRRHYKTWPFECYFKEAEPRFKATLENHEVLVVCNDEQPAQIFAWACFDSRFHLVHFVYTKKRWRGMGLAKMLLNHARLEPPFCTTCPTEHHSFTYIGGI